MEILNLKKNKIFTRRFRSGFKMAGKKKINDLKDRHVRSSYPIERPERKRMKETEQSLKNQLTIISGVQEGE